ncbi:MAG: hypothetical protein JWO04_2785 [Gammaproteobacteria bacterium]|jgi:uncharacterized membrane protein (DUF373 family)|nr:hypothetical protein [Gammaproteobacteria bacterium]HEV7445944.1 phosphate-starvation-inducible PsiE family protein [Steroidobacteraceae bacterium]
MPSERWIRYKARWNVLTYYQRFESAVALVLTAVIALIILVALYRLCVGVVAGLLLGALDPLEHTVFQTVFGQIMTLLIALEFNHTLRFFVTRHESIIQTRVVVLIALLALARKFIILDINETSPGYLLGLAAVTLALGLTYWLMRQRDEDDDRRPGQE